MHRRFCLTLDLQDDPALFEAKAEADRRNPKVQEWGKLMWRFQQALPQAKAGEKRLRMERVFKLEPSS